MIAQDWASLPFQVTELVLLFHTINFNVNQLKFGFNALVF